MLHNPLLQAAKRSFAVARLTRQTFAPFSQSTHELTMNMRSSVATSPDSVIQYVSSKGGKS